MPSGTNLKRDRLGNTMSQHPNSTAAHKQLPSDRHAAVLECYRQHGPLTDRAVAQILFGANADPNTARPRITEAVKAGELVEVDTVADNVTGHKVRRCNLAEAKQFCNCTFAGHLQKVPSKKRSGYVAVVCTNPVHGRPAFYAYQPTGET